MKTIVIVWADLLHVWDGKPFRADLGERPGTRIEKVAHAVVWLLAGSEDDVSKAIDYCERENLRIHDNINKRYVRTYPTTEKDPIGRAKREEMNRGS